VFLAPAEQRLGHLRWITVGLTAHVGATFVSEGLLDLAIDYHQAPRKPDRPVLLPDGPRARAFAFKASIESGETQHRVSPSEIP